jgi:ferritin-like metal-binding protein YciE
MSLFSSDIEDLRTLYVSNFKKALDMEQKITGALPHLIAKSTDPDLLSAFRTHLQELRSQVAKVESRLGTAA